jgi:DNA invertase Pin-like site-specific DNA recombinase
MNQLIPKILPLRAVGYRRVSMRDQVDGHSLDAQEDNIQRYVREQGWQLQKIYIDAGISAKQGSHRPAFEQLMKDAGNKQFDVVVVDKIDRFYRHLSGLLASLDALNEHGVSFASVQEKLDFTSPWGKLMLTVLGMLAEIYIDNLRQETRKGKIQRARKGLWLGGIPFGYCSGQCSNCNDQNGEDYCPNYGGQDQGDGKVIIPHPLESQVVRQVFEWYITGEWNNLTIATALNEMAITRPDGSQVQARQKGRGYENGPGPFTRDVVRDMLKRLAYTGQLPYQGVDANGHHRKREEPGEILAGAHQAIIDVETFNKAQEIRKLRNRISSNANQPVQIFPLTGILYCARCGRRMRGVSKEQRRNNYYQCSSSLDGTTKCSQKLVRAYNVEQQVIKWLKQVVKGFAPDDALLAANSDEYEQRHQRAQSLYLAGEISEEIFLAEKEKWEQIERLLLLPETHAKIKFVNEIAPQIERWDNLEQLNKKRLLRGLVEAIFIHGNALAGITPSSTFLPFVWQVPCLSGEGGIRTRGGV